MKTGRPSVEAEKEALKQDDQRASRRPSPLPSTWKTIPCRRPALVDLAGSLAMQAMIAMGVFANPITGKAEVRMHQARHLIDTLDMLQKKTEGNRTAEETDALEHLLHELRMGFLAVQSGHRTDS